MKHEKILLFWGLALPASIALRLVQLFCTIQGDTGFFKQEFAGFGLAITLIIFVFVALAVFFGFISHRNPESAPQNSLPIAVVSLWFAAASFYEIATVKTVAFAGFWQAPLLKVLSVFAIIFFVVYAISLCTPFVKVPRVFFAIPVFYFIAKIMCDFTSISSLALISDNVFYLASLCSSLVFFLQYFKLYAGFDKERNFRKLLASGIAASVFCLTQSVSYIVYNIANKGGYSHISKAANYGLLATGLFIVIFVLTHFKRKSRR